MYINEIQEFETSTSVYSDNSPSTDDAQKNHSNNLTQKITTYLRWIGSALIILSAISFMLQGYDEILPAYRYWVGLGLTLLLCGGGLICAYLFHETKGARIFFGLGAAFLPVQITQVSAMIYGYWHGQQALQPEYSWLQFMDVSPAIIALDLAITGLLLFLVSYASFSILARKHLKTLLIASAIGNVILMLPIRDGSMVPLMIAGLFIYLRRIEQYLHNDRSMRLKEGLAARALISLPLLIITGRSLLHPTSWILALVVSAMIVVHCIYDIKRYTHSTNIIYLNQWLGTFAAIAGWFSVLSQFETVYSNQFGLFLPIAVILFALSSKVEHHASLYRTISSWLILLLTFGAMIDQQTMAPVIAIAAGILLSMAGIKKHEKTPLVIGNLCVTSGFLYYGKHLTNLYAQAPWASTIGLGLMVILLASYIENKEIKILCQPQVEMSAFLQSRSVRFLYFLK